MSDLNYRIEQLEQELKNLKLEHKKRSLNKQPKENPNYINNKDSKLKQAIKLSEQTAKKEQKYRDTLKKVLEESAKSAKKEQIKQDELYAKEIQNGYELVLHNIKNVYEYENKHGNSDSQFKQVIEFSKQTATKEQIHRDESCAEQFHRECNNYKNDSCTNNDGYVKYYDTKYKKKKLQKKKLQKKCENIRLIFCRDNGDDCSEPSNWY